MAEILTAGALGTVVGFVIGFAAAFLLLRRAARTAERAYQFATAEMRALYEQRIAGVSEVDGQTFPPSGTAGGKP